MAQYRQQIDFTDEAIAAATNGWHTLKEGLLFGYQHAEKFGWGVEEGENSLMQNSDIERFQAAVNDDFNFPGGLAILFELAKELRREGNIIVHQGKTATSPDKLYQQWQTLLTLAGVLGLEAKIETPNSVNDGLSDGEIEDLIQQRQQARQTKNFAESDRIRDQLQTQGITLIDSRDGTRWHRN